MAVLKKEYALSAMHLISPSPFSLVHKKDWLTFAGKTGFPVFAGKHSLGVLICFSALNYLKAQEVRNYINIYLEKVFLQFISNKDSLSVAASSSVPDRLSLPDFALSDERDFSFLLDNEKGGEEIQPALHSKNLNTSNSKKLFSRHNKKQKGVTGKTGLSLFPLLLRQGKKEDLLKQAHELYLKTSSFAFLNADDLNWKEGVFHEMNGVFVCVPFFHQLSDVQKKILIQDLLKDTLSCHLVMGVQKDEELPTEWKDLFCCVL